MLCVISWCSGLELLCCASDCVSLLYWPCCTQAQGSRWTFGRVWRSKSRHWFFSGVWSPLSFHVHCPCVPLVSKTLLAAWAAEHSYNTPALIWGFSGEGEPVLALETIRLGLLPLTASSPCYDVEMLLVFHGLVPLTSLCQTLEWQKSQKVRVKRGLGQEGKIVP